MFTVLDPRFMLSAFFQNGVFSALLCLFSGVVLWHGWVNPEHNSRHHPLSWHPVEVLQGRHFSPQPLLRHDHTFCCLASITSVSLHFYWLLVFLSQQDKASPLSQSTFVEYDFDSPSEDLVGLNTDTSAFGNESVLAQHFDNSGLQPAASEDEGDSALSGRSSEINENRSASDL